MTPGVLGGDAAGLAGGAGLGRPGPLEVPVWVDLDQLYGTLSDEVKPWPGGNIVHGLVLASKVPGRLRRWGRAVDGVGSGWSTSRCATCTAREVVPAVVEVRVAVPHLSPSTR